METTRGLYFEAVGAETAPVVVFLHGGGAAGWMWRKVAASLQGEYRCLLVDLPEQGNSTRAGPFSHGLAADLSADLIREQAGGKAHVVGLSEGAQVVVELLSKSPEVIDHAVISSAILRPIKGTGVMSSPGAVRWSYRLAIAPFKNWDGWIRLNMRYSAGISDEYFADFKRSFQQTTESGFVNILSAVNYRMPAGLERAQAPCLVVVGSKEYREMHDSARDLLSVLPNSRGVEVSLGAKATLASEHNWAMTAPELFAQTVSAWIEGRALPDELSELSDNR